IGDKEEPSFFLPFLDKKSIAIWLVDDMVSYRFPFPPFYKVIEYAIHRLYHYDFPIYFVFSNTLVIKLQLVLPFNAGVQR
ncbi:MAG: hypothetical protein ACJ70T_03615, partial [Nitrososphaera sp.]